jgi:hypothetical protein
MASLVLLVAIMFLVVLASGPLALLLASLGFKILAVLFAIVAILAGLNWILVAPLPISLAGALGVILGLGAIKIAIRR